MSQKRRKRNKGNGRSSNGKEYGVGRKVCLGLTMVVLNKS
jgi:hypothetical protein